MMTILNDMRGWLNKVTPSIEDDPLRLNMVGEITYLIHVFSNKKNRPYHYKSCEKMISNFREKWCRQFPSAEGIFMVQTQVDMLYTWLNRHLYPISACDSCDN